MKKAPIVSIFLLLGALLPMGCNMQKQPPPPQPSPQPVPDNYYGRYRPWAGPGRYYGVYFYNERSYNQWTRRHHNRTQYGRWDQSRRDYRRDYHSGSRRGGRHR